MKSKEVLLGEIFDIERGGSPRPIQNFLTDDADGIPWIMIGDTEQGGKYINSTKSKIKRTGIRKSREVYPGELLLSNSMSFGRPYILRTYGCIHDGWLILRPKTKEMDTNYAYHVLGSQKVMAQFQKKAAGATVKNLNKAIVASTIIYLPPLEEQRRIAAILDKASQIDALCDTAIDKHRALDESLFLNFFADLDSGRFSSLKHLSSKETNSIRTGPFGSQLLHSEFTDSGVAVLGIDNAVKNEFSWKKNRFISQEKYEQLKRYTVNPGDVLITIMGTCGRVAVVPEDIPVAINTKHLCAISLDHSQVLPDYLHKFILYHPAAKSYLKQRTKGAIMGGLNMGIIKELPVLVPTLSSQLEWLHQKNTAQNMHQKALIAKAQSLSLKMSLTKSLVEAANA